MNLFKFIWKYWTNSTFRYNVSLIMHRIENAEEIDQKFKEELEEIRKKTLDLCKKRIDDLVYIKDDLHGEKLTKVNDFINELKEDYREIEKEIF